jgi:hypothetical protein
MYIHNTAVDVAELLETEETGPMGRVIECVGLGSVSMMLW